VPVCPELEAGFGVPRESMRLQKDGEETRLVTNASKKDLTAPMERFARKRVAQLRDAGLHGYLLKKSSPSCGMERVRVYAESGIPKNEGVGLFAAALRAEFPHLPIEEEGRLHNPVLRENWIERVFAYRDLRNLFDQKWGLKDLVAFHTRYKLNLLAHSTTAYQSLGRWVADAKNTPKAKLADEYEAQFMRALAILSTRKKHTNVLQHMLGYLKSHLDRSTKSELVDLIDEYRRGLYPLTVPLTLLGHYVKKHQITYLLGQAYLNPHPKELALRNFIHPGK